MKTPKNRSGVKADPWIMLLLIVIVSVFSFSLLYPALNWPDEIYKLSQLTTSDNLYLRFVNWLRGGDCAVSYSSQAPGIYGTNKFSIQIISGVDCYRETKFFNAILISILIYLSFSLLKKYRNRDLLLLSLIWPSSLFFLTSVNNQVVFHVFSIALAVYSIHKKNLIVPIITSLLLISIDRSFITTFLFFSLLQSFRFNKFVMLAAFLTLFAVTYFADEQLSSLYSLIMGPNSIELFEITKATEQYRDSPLLSFALLAVSFVYLGGAAAVFGIGLDYLFVYFYLIRMFLKKDNNEKNEIYKLLICFITTFFVILNFVPSIASYRYYIFITPYIIYYLVPDRHRKYYIYYCIFMNITYILLAYLVQGADF